MEPCATSLRIDCRNATQLVTKSSKQWHDYVALMLFSLLAAATLARQLRVGSSWTLRTKVHVQVWISPDISGCQSRDKQYLLIAPRRSNAATKEKFGTASSKLVGLLKFQVLSHIRQLIENLSERQKQSKLHVFFQSHLWPRRRMIANAATFLSKQRMSP